MKWTSLRNRLVGIVAIGLAFLLISQANGNMVILLGAVVLMAIGLFLAILGDP